MSRIFGVLLLNFVLIRFGCVGATENYKLLERILRSCLDGASPISCLSNRTEKMITKLIDKDVPLFDGMVFKKNHQIPVNQRNSRSSRGLKETVSQFLDSHTLSLDLSESRDGGSKGDSYGGFGKVDKKDKKYLYYAMTAVAGIFGLSVPFVLKGLAILAGKALLASKAALIIIGSVALKKIFQSEKEPVNVHTHTVTLDDHDRMSGNNYNYPYHSYAPY